MKLDNNKKRKVQEIVTESIVALRQSTTTPRTVPELTQLNRLAEIDTVQSEPPIVCINCQKDDDPLVKLESLANLKTSSKYANKGTDNRKKVEQLVSLRLQALKDSSTSIDYPELSSQDLSQIQQISESELQEIVFAKVRKIWSWQTI